MFVNRPTMLHGVCFKAVLILPDDGILGELNSPAVRPWSAAVLLEMCLFFLKTPLPRHCSVIVTNIQVMSRYSPIRASVYRAHSALADEQLHSPVKVVFSASLLWCFSAVEHFGATQSKVPKWLSARARGLGSATRGLINSSLPNNRVYRYDNSAWTSRGCKKKIDQFAQSSQLKMSAGRSCCFDFWVFCPEAAWKPPQIPNGS